MLPEEVTLENFLTQETNEPTLLEEVLTEGGVLDSGQLVSFMLHEAVSLVETTLLIE